MGTAIDAIYGDCFNRFFGRMNDGNTYFSMGTDEHSFKIADKAKDLNTTPKEFVDKKYNEFKDFYDSVDILADNFIQSSDPKHYWLANIVWETLKNKNLIYKKTYHGLYCKGCEDFYAPSQLIDGKCPIHPNLEIQEVDEENYFFKLTAYKEEILAYLEEVNVPDKSVITEMKNFAKDLQDISISRDRGRLSIDWGVPVNSDSKHIMYVWFEALLTYLTPLVSDEFKQEWEENINKEEVEQKIWSELSHKLPQDLQIIGRDNSKFHLIIYPAILTALNLPKINNLIIHGMITDSQGRKFAKSLGNGFELEDFISKFGTEGVRFFVLHDVNPVGDTAFDWERAVNSYNTNLADNLGNLTVRITNLIQKNLDGYTDFDLVDYQELVDLNSVYQSLQNLNPQKAMQELFNQCTKINQYLEETRPWELAKNLEENKKEIDKILNLSGKSLLEISKVLAIFMPDTGEKVYNYLNAEKVVKSPILFNKVEM